MAPRSARAWAAALLLSAPRRAAGAPAGDEVASLPGLDGALPSRHYSGFLATDPDGASGGERVHYWLAESEGDPASDPVVFWFNGGPPCSAVGGLLTELGPFSVRADLTLALREGRWTRAATLVFVETPLGVGFSYDAAGRRGRYAADDATTAAINLRAVRAVYAAFPALRPLPLFLAGESYAGVYVPMLAQAVRAWNEDPATPPGGRLPLRGVLVGNGAVATGDWYEAGLAGQRMRHLYAHALFSPKLRTEIDAACGNYTAPLPAACDALLQRMHTETGNLNQYDIRQTCGAAAAPPPRRPAQAPLVAAEDPCQAPSDHMTRWLNLAEVQAALHVSDAAAKGGSWASCGSSFGHPVTYHRIPQDERKTVWPDLIGRYRVLVYNGDQDNCIPYVQDEEWTAAAGQAEKRGWHPWLVSGQVAGYAVEYEGNLTFTTVKGAGHMVPEFQPERALAMLTRFIGGVPL